VRDSVPLADGDIEVTCIDNGMPLVILRASDVGCTGQESPAELDANAALKARLEELRLACGVLMGLGDVTERNYPKMTLVSPPHDHRHPRPLHHRAQGAGSLAQPQIAGIQDPASMPSVADLKISDDELREPSRPTSCA
jgi:2-methylaconitate cis-trans-isomerase PrpF